MDEQTKAMHDILSKLQGVDKTTKIVAERAENDVDLNIAINQKITENRKRKCQEDSFSY